LLHFRLQRFTDKVLHSGLTKASKISNYVKVRHYLSESFLIDCFFLILPFQRFMQLPLPSRLLAQVADQVFTLSPSGGSRPCRYERYAHINTKTAVTHHSGLQIVTRPAKKSEKQCQESVIFQCRTSLPQSLPIVQVLS